MIQSLCFLQETTLTDFVLKIDRDPQKGDLTDLNVYQEFMAYEMVMLLHRAYTRNRYYGNRKGVLISQLDKEGAWKVIRHFSLNVLTDLFEGPYHLKPGFPWARKSGFFLSNVFFEDENLIAIPRTGWLAEKILGLNESSDSGGSKSFHDEADQGF